MKKFLVSFLAASAAFVFAAAAHAEGWYAGGYGLLNYTHDGSVNGSGTAATYDLGYGAGAYAGMYFNPNLRLEGELSYRTNDVDTIGGVGVGGDVKAKAVMVNLFYDFKPGDALNPHIGAGVGVADVDYTAGGGAYTDTVVAMQLGVGIDYALRPDVALTVDYRLFGTDNLSIGGGAGLGDVEYWNSAVLIGLRKKF